VRQDDLGVRFEVASVPTAVAKLAPVTSKGGSVKGVRHFLRNFTANAVREHLRSAVEAADGCPALTVNEIELVRFVCEGPFDWRAYLAERPRA
jgi:hypothetical protein